MKVGQTPESQLVHGCVETNLAYEIAYAVYCSTVVIEY